MMEIEAIEQSMGTAAYLKLGCKKVSFYCYQSLLWHYNADIRIDELNNMTAAVLSSPSPVETQSEFNQPIQQSQIEDNWISFDAIARTLGVDRDYVEDETERLDIAITRRNRVLGLSNGNLEIYLERRYTQTKQQFNQMLSQASRTSSRQSSPAATKLKAVPTVISSDTNGIASSGDGLCLPLGFNMMDGRRRRPDILTALKLAIATLPDANDETTKKMYVRRIAMREDVENFLNGLASQFEGSAKFKNVPTTAKEIVTAAFQLWNEYQDSASASA
jgi:hypothetical protein